MLFSVFCRVCLLKGRVPDMFGSPKTSWIVDPERHSIAKDKNKNKIVNLFVNCKNEYHVWWQQNSCIKFLLTLLLTSLCFCISWKQKSFFQAKFSFLLWNGNILFLTGWNLRTCYSPSVEIFGYVRIVVTTQESKKEFYSGKRYYSYVRKRGCGVIV